jgi:glucose repression mediator protein
LASQENPKLWYGIGILYDRYGSLDNAEEAFSSVLKMDKGNVDLYPVPFMRSADLRSGFYLDFDKSNEVLFRLGIIYKQQTKYEESLHCFERILRSPPSPLANADIFFQIGHVYEQQGDVSLDGLLLLPHS